MRRWMTAIAVMAFLAFILLVAPSDVWPGPF